MKTNLIEDLSNITTIPKAALEKLNEKSMWIVCDDMQTALLDKSNICEIDIGIGTLLITVEDDELLYKFIPSDQLEQALQKTVLNGANPLVNKAEKLLVDKIINVYKDFM